MSEGDGEEVKIDCPVEGCEYQGTEKQIAAHANSKREHPNYDEIREEVEASIEAAGTGSSGSDRSDPEEKDTEESDGNQGEMDENEGVDDGESDGEDGDDGPEQSPSDSSDGPDDQDADGETETEESKEGMASREEYNDQHESGRSDGESDGESGDEGTDSSGSNGSIGLPRLSTGTLLIIVGVTLVLLVIYLRTRESDGSTETGDEGMVDEQDSEQIDRESVETIEG